jgi:hypothetical protein
MPVLFPLKKSTLLLLLLFVFTVVTIKNGVFCDVALVGADVSEACIASIIRATKLGELGTMLALTSNRIMLRRNTIVPAFL